MAVDLGPQYLRPDGTVGAAGAATSTATRADYGTVQTGVTRFVNERTVTTRTSVPPSPATRSAEAWVAASAIAEHGVRIVGDQTWPCSVTLTDLGGFSERTHVIVYAGDTEIARGSAATDAGMTTAAFSVPLTTREIARIPPGERFAVEVYIEVALGVTLPTASPQVVLTTGGTATFFDPGMMPAAYLRRVVEVEPAHADRADRDVDYARVGGEQQSALDTTTHSAATFARSATDAEPQTADVSAQGVGYERSAAEVEPGHRSLAARLLRLLRPALQPEPTEGEAGRRTVSATRAPVSVDPAATDTAGILVRRGDLRGGRLIVSPVKAPQPTVKEPIA